MGCIPISIRYLTRRFGQCERSSVVELHVANVTVEGSNPFARSSLRTGRVRGVFCYSGGVAQLAEQRTLNPRVQGSSPCASTTLRSLRELRVATSNIQQGTPNFQVREARE